MPATKTMVEADLPRLFDDRVECPAGVYIAETIAGSGCHCRVEHSDLLAAKDPSSLKRYCLSLVGHQMCPTWRAEKEAIWADRDVLADD